MVAPTSTADQPCESRDVIAPVLAGLHHVELTVRDLSRSVDWYTSVLGFEEVGRLDKPGLDVVMLRHASGLLVVLVQHEDAGDAPFDERRPGLDHLGFAATGPDDVDAWAARLDDLGVARSEVKDGSLPGSRLVVFRDPDNIQIEIYFST
jgi:glyoxylase I family protein